MGTINTRTSEGVVATCPKHGKVICTDAEFDAEYLAKLDGNHKRAVHFYPAPIAHRSDEN